MMNSTGLSYNPYQQRARKRLKELQARKRRRGGESYDWMYPSLLTELYLLGVSCWSGFQENEPQREKETPEV